MSATGQISFDDTVISARQGNFRVEEYRAYLVGIDGHFVGFEPIVCADDMEAIAKAQRLVDGHDVELWSGPRMVIRFEQKPK